MYQSAGLSDPGRRRQNNEDRFYADAAGGVFFVIDGVGGQAAGEKAADTAFELLRARLLRPTGTPVERIREAIALANNEIFRLSEENSEWHGMACVLTAVVLENGTATIGQVGDSRLYLVRPGEIYKVTHDHSPVGEREDRGELDEVSAMRHPRRNEVFRDVGSQPHEPDDPDFIEISTAAFPGDGVLLLCTDGLSDLVTSRQMLAIIESHAGTPQLACQSLIDAANEAGGKDNITVIVVEGDRFAPAVRRRLSSPRTTLPVEIPRRNPFLSPIACVLYGIVGTLIAVYVAQPHWIDTGAGTAFSWGTVREARTWRVSAGLSGVIQKAQAGDTVLVAPGTYEEPIRMKEGVQIVSEYPQAAVLLAGDVAVIADNLRTGSLRGFRITADPDGVLQYGIQISNANVEIQDNEISGAATAGIECSGNNTAVIRSNQIVNNARAAIVIRDMASPRILHNVLSAQNHPAIVVVGSAKPVIRNNVLISPELVFAPEPFDAAMLARENFWRKPESPPTPRARGRTQR
jgi:serine/threonine protein phosphatase PrpC